MDNLLDAETVDSYSEDGFTSIHQIPPGIQRYDVRPFSKRTDITPTCPSRPFVGKFLYSWRSSLLQELRTKKFSGGNESMSGQSPLSSQHRYLSVAGRKLQLLCGQERKDSCG
jgi:hypothetical protein